MTDQEDMLNNIAKIEGAATYVAVSILEMKKAIINVDEALAQFKKEVQEIQDIYMEEKGYR